LFQSIVEPRSCPSDEAGELGAVVGGAGAVDGAVASGVDISRQEAPPLGAALGVGGAAVAGAAGVDISRQERAML
jgi:hypothetical protein